ncbi:MAG: TonB-dependent receptor [Dysgonamonadaceae bacterium]|nr:TonB-dependent receptor [Dysgonamonadaceae bacterium]
MKIAFLLLVTGLLQLSASVSAQNKRMTIDNGKGDLTVKDVLKMIESHTDYTFSYNSAQIDVNRTVKGAFRNMRITEILDKILPQAHIEYLIEGTQIFLFSAEPKATNKVQPGGIPVTGVITDENGDPLPGVNVTVKGTMTGVTTDNNGKYSVAVSGSEAVLVFSFVGYTTQEITVGDQTNISLTLGESATQIEEVVVVGYGVQKKGSVVGSIVQANSEELMKSGNVTDLKQALTGRLPGVITSVSTNEPGGYGDGSSATSIFIRGRNSWNSSQPLILVDGIERNMENVDVTEVESISVLKDASATAVFGVKGANGVILITTKRGKESKKPRLSFSYDATMLMLSKLPEKLDSYDALNLRNESILRNVAYNESIWSDYTPDEILRRYRERDYPEYEMLYPNVDWESALFKKTGWSQKVAMNIQGGNDFVKYFGALTYFHEGDMFKQYENFKGYDPNFDFDRFNFRSNFDFNLTKSTILKISLSGYYSKKNTNYSYTNEHTGTHQYIWAAIYNMGPDMFLPQYEDGSWGIQQSPILSNPVSTVYNLGIFERKTTDMDVNISLEQKLDFITKGLSIGGTYYYDYNVQTVGGVYDVTNGVVLQGHIHNIVVYPDMYTGPGQNPDEYIVHYPITGSSDFDWVADPWTRIGEGITSSYTGRVPVSRRKVYQAQVNYGRSFGTLHNVSAMGVFKREEYATGSEFPHYREDWISRLTYDYDSRYFIEGNGAYNGSEKFASNYRFDFFPSLAVGWYVSNEKFFKWDWMNKLKLRYSLGLVGDDSAGARWAYQTQYSYGEANRLQQYIYNTSPYTQYRETVVANPDLHWEKAKKSNYGVETGFLNNLFSVNFDYFTENRTDIIIAGTDRATAPYFGATPPAANLGKVDARGFEIEVNIDKHTAYGLDYWAAFAFTHTRNKIVFRDDPQLRAAYLKQQDYSVGQNRSLVNTGFYQNWDDIYASVPQEVNDLYKMPGYYNMLDYNGDGAITSAGDVIPSGYSDLPENTCNLSLGASYKGFAVTVQFYGVNNVTQNAELYNFFNQSINNMYGHTRDYWAQDNPDATSFLPRWKTQGEFIGNYYITDGSYIRLKTAEIAYNFQKTVLDKLPLAGLRVFVNGNNLWYWSRLPYDRENTWSGGSSAMGAYPTVRRINFGINIIF